MATQLANRRDASASRVLMVGETPALSTLLHAAGYDVAVAADLPAAIDALLETEPDIILLDGEALNGDDRPSISALRASTQASLLLLSPPGWPDSTLAAIEEGVDDYIDLPLENRSFLTRLYIAERRRARKRRADAVFSSGPLRVDFARRQVSITGRTVRLSPKEYALLALLIRQSGRPVPHQQLLQAGWGNAVKDSQYLRVYIGLLRQKLEEDPSDPKLILTEPGIGYRLAD